MVGSNTYDATSMNLFCASCHGLFHSLSQGSGGVWLRHPTDVSLSDKYPTGTLFTGSTTVPMGNAAAKTDVVMCISCHKPHGSAQADLMRFDYGGNQAGDSTGVTGCEDCHGAM